MITKHKKFWSLSLSIVSLAFLAIEPAFAATITREWISKDRSIATVTLKGGEEVLLPGKGGGTVVVRCRGAISCTVEVADFKDKKGNITYSTNLSSLQNIPGTIDSGTGIFRITTTGDLEGLFSDVTVNGNLINSTGFNATIGSPGNQIPQGGAISYSTQWFSDQAIGIDPDTGEEIILGNFFLNSTNPLSAFEYTVTNPELALISSTFTIGEKYIFSTGLEITGNVTKELITVVPEPTSTLGILALGTLGAASTLKRQLKSSKSSEKETTKVS